MLKLDEISAEFAYHIAESIDMPAHIKDAKTKQYIYSNTQNLEIYGAKSISEIIGKTVTNLDKNMKSQWGNTFAQYVDYMDNQVVANQTTLTDIRSILSISGMLRLQKMVKIPLVRHKKTIAIFTFSQNLAHTLSITDLYSQYRMFYSKHDAVVYFLKHLNIAEYFVSLPTEAEIKVLIAKTLISRNKDIAQQLNISEKTIEAHTLSIRNKLSGSNIFTILSILRNIEIR